MHKYAARKLKGKKFYALWKLWCKFFRRKKQRERQQNALTKRKVLRVFTISSVQGSSMDCCESKIIIKSSEIDNCIVKHDIAIIVKDLKLLNFSGNC